MKHYYELKNDVISKQQVESSNEYICIDQFKIKLMNEFTCPAHTMIFFAHDQDLDYEQVFKK